MLRKSKVRTNASGRLVRPNDFGKSERYQDGCDEGCKPRPGAAGAVERDRPERREQRPQNHRARRVETAEHDHPGRGRDENQQLLRGPQGPEILGPREDGETDRRPGDVCPRRQRNPALTDGPVQAAPDEADREDEQRHPDEEALPKRSSAVSRGSAPMEMTRSRNAGIITSVETPAIRPIGQGTRTQTSGSSRRR